jgi:hypothetical protein
MKHRVAFGLTLAVCAAAEAAEPVASSQTPSVAPVVVTAPASTRSAFPEAKPHPTKPLDLRIGDVRKYMMPNEFNAALSAPDADSDTVVVEAHREQLPMKFEKPVPGGIIAPFWALAHPLQSWRILVPDLNMKHVEEGPRDPADKVPPPIFRWGP